MPRGRKKGSKVKVGTVPVVTDTFQATFQAKLQANNTEYLGEGESVLEALNNLPLHYLDLKTKGTIVVRRGEYIAERFFFHRPLKFLIRNEARRQYWAQLLEAELKSKHG